MSSRVVNRLSGFALLRYRVWDIDLIINRTLAICLGGRYRGVLTVSIVAIYILVVVGLGSLLQAQGNLGIALLATGLVAVLFQLLRTRLQRDVNRLLYGDRDEFSRVGFFGGSRLRRAPIRRGECMGYPPRNRRCVSTS